MQHLPLANKSKWFIIEGMHFVVKKYYFQQPSVAYLIPYHKIPVVGIPVICSGKLYAGGAAIGAYYVTEPDTFVLVGIQNNIT